MDQNTVVRAILQMLATPDLTERYTIVLSELWRMGWNRVRLVVYEPRFYMMIATAGGVAVSKKDDSALWWRNAEIALHAPLIGQIARRGTLEGESEAGLLFPLGLPESQITALLCLDHPRPAVESVLPIYDVELLAVQVASVLETATLRDALQNTKDQLTEQVEDLTVLQNVDEELSASLNLENVMMLATDWALRRTGARTVILAVADSTSQTMRPLVMLGYPRGKAPYSAENPIPVTEGIIGRAVRTNQLCLVNDVDQDPDYRPTLAGMKAQIAVPLISQNYLLGVLSLESDRSEGFHPQDVEFIKRLGTRAAVALDNARLYREAEKRADEASALYTAGRAISSTLEREEILPRVVQSIALVLNSTGALVADVRFDRATATVLHTYRIPTVHDSDLLPAAEKTIDLDLVPTVFEALQQHRTIALRLADPTIGTLERQLMREWNIHAALVAPLTVGEEMLGLVIVTESRADRIFTDDELLLFETLASQSAVALRQAKLYDGLRELENLKSEMIRMASHDLRNPLGNMMGFIEIFGMTLQDRMDSEELEYLAYMKRSANTMKSLIDDLLTLEKIESERAQSWSRIDFGQLIHEVYDAQKATAELKQHVLLFDYETPPIFVLGSTTQLRQAATNLVGNALKYTPTGGQVVVRLAQRGSRVEFEVQDNGYGISPDRQKRLFQRFYRAKQPGTEEIPGTGLGLSMVKTVIERHRGEVWLRSTEKVGSTFGFWLPNAEAMAAASNLPPMILEEL